MEILGAAFYLEIFVGEPRSVEDNLYVRVYVVNKNDSFYMDMLAENYLHLKKYKHSVGEPPYKNGMRRKVIHTADLLKYLDSVSAPLA